jgi:hypothetical protein
MGLLVLIRRWCLGLLTVASVLWYVLAGLPQPLMAEPAENIVIVANQLYPVSKLTKEQVQEIYLGRRTIEQFLRIRPIDQSDPAIRTAFLHSVMDLSKEAYIDHWNRLLFQQGGLPPLLKDSPDDVIKELLKTDGSIGYLWDQDWTQQSKLKVLLVVPVR